MSEDAEGLLAGKSVDSLYEDRNEQVSRKWKPRCPLLLLAACISSIGGILFGYDVGIIAGAMLQLREEFKLSCSKREAVVTSLLVGGLLASISGGYLVDKFGRRIAIILNSFIFVAGALVLSFSQSYFLLLFGRLLIGFAVSLSAIGECIYISEIAPPKRRGSLVSLNELGITIGILLAYLVGFCLIKQSNGWRWMFGLSVIFGILQAVGMFFLPSSPRWLISKGRMAEAERVIVALWPKTDPKSQVNQLKSSMDNEKQYRVLDLFRTSGNMRFRMFIGCGLVFLQQVTGQPTVLYYASAVFQSLGFTSGPGATLATVGLGSVKVICTIIALLLVDRFGRRCFLLVGVVSMTSGLIVLSIITQPLQLQNRASYCHKPTIVGHHSVATYRIPTESSSSCSNNTVEFKDFSHNGVSNCSKIKDIFHENSGVLTNTTNTKTGVRNAVVEGKTTIKFSQASKYICLISLMGFVAGYAVGFGPMSWLILSEIFPVALKGRAVAVATIFNWGTNIVISSTFLSIIDGIGVSWTFGMYAAIASVSVIFVYHFIPETKRKTLEQISDALNKRTEICPDNGLCCQQNIVVHVDNTERIERRVVLSEDIL